MKVGVTYSKISLLAAAAISMGAVSCQRKGQDAPGAHNTISLTVDEEPATKVVTAGQPEEVLNMPFVTEDGDTLVLKAFISDAASVAETADAQTKGAPVTNDNIAAIVGGDGFKMSVFNNGQPYSYPDYDDGKIFIPGKSMSDVTAQFADGSWDLVGGPYYWPEDDSDLTFCSYTPVRQKGTISNLSWNNGAKATFHLAQTSGTFAKTDAVDQEDVLFAINTQNLSDSRTAKIHFRHALAAVKFARGTIEGCTVASVVLENFYTEGDCTFSPDGKFVWTKLESKKTLKQAFDTNIGLDDPEHMPFDKSDDGRRTFMMIPQKLSEDAVIRINLEQKLLHPIVFPIGQYADSKLNDWSNFAGKVLTFTVNTPEEEYTGVNIEVVSQVASTVVTNANVKNINRSDVFVRANVVANWVDGTGDVIAPLMGSEIAFEKSADFSNYWYYDEESETYYYKYPVAKDQTPVRDLFTRYAKPASPDHSKHNLPASGHVEIIVLGQAIEADADKAYVTAAGWNPTAVAWMSATRN